MKAIHEQMEQQLRRIFPRDFEYLTEKGGSRTKPLFGDLVEALRLQIDDEETGGEQAHLNSLRKMKQGTTNRISITDAPDVPWHAHSPNGVWRFHGIQSLNQRKGAHKAPGPQKAETVLFEEDA